jgi:hypothetical protein
MRRDPGPMPEPWRITPAEREQTESIQPSGSVARIAERQFGVLTWEQLLASGLSKSAISRWVSSGRLHRIHPRVYAVGHRALSEMGRLAAALLYAGPGAALSHETGAWWLEISKRRPTQLAVSAPSRRRSLPNIRVHHPRHLERVWHRGLPVTPPGRTLLDFAASAPRADVRRALAEAFYLRLVTVEAVEAVLGRGHPGSAALREALVAHTPELARTRSLLEQRFLELCERYAIPMPEVNVRIEGMRPDAVWRRQRVVVELDSRLAHGQAARVEEDRRRELKLRAAGWQVLRYSWQLITREPQRVAADLFAALRLAAAG